MHWSLVSRASETACGIDRGEPSLQNPPTTRLEDYVTCPDCKFVIVGYKFGRATVAGLVETLEYLAKEVDGDVDYLTEIEMIHKAIAASKP